MCPPKPICIHMSTYPLHSWSQRNEVQLIEKLTASLWDKATDQEICMPNHIQLQPPAEQPHVVPIVDQATTHYSLSWQKLMCGGIGQSEWGTEVFIERQTTVVQLKLDWQNNHTTRRINGFFFQWNVLGLYRPIHEAQTLLAQYDQLVTGTC